MHEAAGMEVPIGTRAGEYEITGLLGAGGMGTVYAGVHPVIGTKVAIKVIHRRLGADTELLARFLQEARVVNKIRQPNIIDIFAFGESPELGHYFVMPLLEGRSLGARIADEGPLPVEAALPIVRQIADALDAAHDAGVCHRDLKPENVWLIPERRGGELVKVLDFGLAKLTDGDGLTTRRGQQLFGTPLFMSPEQWNGSAIDHRSDVYALGVLLHHTVTGRYPFESGSPVGLMNLHLNKPPALPSQHGGPAAVDSVVAKALAKSREDRFQSAGELCDALAATTGVRGSDPALATTLEPEPEPGPAPAPRRGRWVLLSVGVVVGLAAVLLLARNRSEDAPPPPPPAPAPAPVVAAATPPDARPVEKLVNVRINSIPPGATVSRASQLLGTTPLVTTLPAGGDIDLVLDLEGFLPAVLSVSLSTDVDRTAKLKRKGRTAPPPTATEGSKWGETEKPAFLKDRPK